MSNDIPAPAEASQSRESGEATRPISRIKFKRGDLFTLLPGAFVNSRALNEIRIDTSNDIVWLLSESLRCLIIFPRKRLWFEIVFSDFKNNETSWRRSLPRFLLQV